MEAKSSECSDEKKESDEREVICVKFSNNLSEDEGEFDVHVQGISSGSTGQRAVTKSDESESSNRICSYLESFPTGRSYPENIHTGQFHVSLCSSNADNEAGEELSRFGQENAARLSDRSEFDNVELTPLRTRNAEERPSDTPEQLKSPRESSKPPPFAKQCSGKIKHSVVEEAILRVEQWSSRIKSRRTDDGGDTRASRNWHRCRCWPSLSSVLRGREWPAWMSRSLFLFDKESRIRLLCEKISTDRRFDIFIIFSIIATIVFMAMEEPNVESKWNDRLEIVDLGFTAIFTLEIAVKAIASGFMGSPTAYIRDGWNKLDFIVGIGCVLSHIPGIVTVSSIRSLRALRALRPIRVVNRFQKLRILVYTVLSSLPLLVDVLILAVFFVFVFGLVGVELFSGALRKQCLPEVQALNSFVNSSSIYGEILSSGLVDHVQFHSVEEFESFLDKALSSGHTGIYYDLHPSDLRRRCAAKRTYDEYICQGFLSCQTEGNPNNGVTSFDNIFSSMLAVFQSMTLEGWTSIMYDLWDAKSSLVVAYFVIVIILGAFCIMNLTLAVIYDNFKRRRIEVSSLPKEREQNIETVSQEVQPEIADKPRSEDIEGSEREWTGLRRAIRILIFSRAFQWLIVSVIAINTISMGIQYYGMSEAFRKTTEDINLACTAIFVLELILKLIGLTPKEFASDAYNIFDVVIVLISMVDIILELSRVNFDAGGITTLRALRILRICKLAKSWTSLQVFLDAMIISFRAVGPFLLLLVLYVIVLALLGMQIFGNMVRTDTGDPPRSNFDDFFWAFITTFQIITGENWNDVLFDGVESVGWISTIFFITVFALGNAIMLNLFLAVLIDSFTENKNKMEAASFQGLRAKDRVDNDLVGQALPSGEASSDEPDSSSKVPIALSRAPSSDLEVFDRSRSILSFRISEEFPIPESSSARIRWIVEHNYFEWVVAFLVILSSIVLTLDRPSLDQESFEGHLLNISGYIFAALFSAEMMLKFIAFGLKAYFRDRWNILDAMIVLFSIVSIWLKEAQYLRVFRALRPLRLVNRQASLRLVVSCLGEAVVASANVVMVGTILWLAFSIIGAQLFMGQLRGCVDVRAGLQYDSEKALTLPSSPEDCRGLNEQINGTETYFYFGPVVPYDFDNAASASLMLFEIATMEMWPEYMISTVDARGPNRGPKKNHQPSTMTLHLFKLFLIHGWVAELGLNDFKTVLQAVAVFFILFLFLGALFFTNLFVGIVIDAFNSLKRRIEQQRLSPLQKHWKNLEQRMAKMQPITKIKVDYKSWIRSLASRLISHSWFEPFVSALITISAIIFSIQHYNQSHSIAIMLFVAGWIFSSLFVLEALVKITAVGPTLFFRDGWNIFDFVIAVVSMAVLMFDLGSSGEALRMIRIFRLVRLAKAHKGVQTLLRTIASSLPGIVHVGALLFLVMFTYAIMGVALFGDVPHQNYLNDRANFENFQTALLTLFRVGTGESWNAIMRDIMARSPFCTGSHCAPLGAIPFFISYVILVQFLLLNIIVAIVIDSFSEIYETENRVINEEVLEHFNSIWSLYDPLGSGAIKADHMKPFLIKLGSPLGYDASQYGSLMEMLAGIPAFRAIWDKSRKEYTLQYRNTLMSLAHFATLVDPAYEGSEHQHCKHWITFRVFQSFKTSSKSFKKTRESLSHSLSVAAAEIPSPKTPPHISVMHSFQGYLRDSREWLNFLPDQGQAQQASSPMSSTSSARSIRSIDTTSKGSPFFWKRDICRSDPRGPKSIDAQLYYSSLVLQSWVRGCKARKQRNAELGVLGKNSEETNS